ncbi:hypothetical protein HU200_064178 [Digitaria exilis]|uniref:NAD-dependent epimerase/dehydratase domain-containing protein n=1 Tax=Digitaria exilis TaxID=1010633 RepID=A0A835DVQ3_9POAL|nr:hypothetical protein HU200_064178 [Digitaria exilis]
MPATPRSRSQARNTRPWILSGMDFADSRRKPNFTGKIAVAAALTVMCIIVLKQSPGFSGTSVVNKIFSENAFDAVMHFAAVAYVGESTMEPLRYYHNITSNTLTVLEAMAAHNVNTLIYLEYLCTYGEPDTMPLILSILMVRGTDYPTADGTCIRDYIDVTDLVDAHVKALDKSRPGKVGIYNVGTGQGRSVKEFVEACKKATGATINVEFLARRPGDYARCTVIHQNPQRAQLDGQIH